MNTQQPTIGRIVHYTNLGDKDGRYPPEVQAAIITGVYQDKMLGSPGGIGPVLEKANQVGQSPNTDWVDLRIFYRTGEFLMERVPFSSDPTRGHWNWPPRT